MDLKVPTSFVPQSPSHFDLRFPVFSPRDYSHLSLPHPSKPSSSYENKRARTRVRRFLLLIISSVPSYCGWGVGMEVPDEITHAVHVCCDGLDRCSLW